MRGLAVFAFGAAAMAGVAGAASAASGEELWSLSLRSRPLGVASYETAGGKRVQPGQFSELTLLFKHDRLAVALTQSSRIHVEQSFNGEYDLLLTITNMQCRIEDRVAARCEVAVRYASNSPQTGAACWYAFADGSKNDLISFRDCPSRFDLKR